MQETFRHYHLARELDKAESLTTEPAITIPITEQEPADVLLTDLFEEGLPGRVDANEHREAPAGIMDSSFTRRTQGSGPMRVFVQHSRRRGLELGLVLSVTVAVVCSALWLSGTVITEPHSYTPNTSLHVTKMTMQVLATQTTTISAAQFPVQPSVQTTTIATKLPSAQATLPVTQPPSPMETPTPTPTMPISYEAEDPQNTLAGGAKVIGCPSCSGGGRVGYIGPNNGAMGTLQFNGISKSSNGNYTLTIYYNIAGSDKLTGYTSVNGGPAVRVDYPSIQANGGTIGAASITISLHAGKNTIEFSNPSVYAPDIDRIVV